MAKERIVHYRRRIEVYVGGRGADKRKAVCGWVRWGIKKRKVGDKYVYLQHSYTFDLSSVTCPTCVKKAPLLVLDEIDL